MNLKRKHSKKVNEIIIVAQFFSIIIVSVAVVNHFQIKSFQSFSDNMLNFFYFAMVFTLFLIIGLLYLEKNFIKRSDKKITWYSYFFNISLLLIVVFIINLTGKEQSPFEILFILPVITTAITHGVRGGLFFAGVESAYIFSYHYPAAMASHSLTLDTSIMYISILFLAAWLIGSFTELEHKTRTKLENLVNIDALTELSNHRHFQEVLHNKISAADRKKEQLSLIFGDVDYFKYYNDIFGHQEGDKVLQTIGKILAENLPPNCIAARYGGDEFAIILPCYSQGEAVEVAERLRKKVEEIHFFGQEHLPHENITLSLGVATYPENAKTPKELLSVADEALYSAKYMQRNRVKLYFSVLDELKSKLKDDETEIISSLRTFLSIINAKDRYTYGHSERVMEYAVEMAETLNFTKEEADILKYSAFLHDIGKIEVDRYILSKQTKLTYEEMEVMKKHTTNGADIIRPIKPLYKCADIVKYHHENFDGSGYPDKLSGRHIPVGARILRIIDSYDAMVTDRPYQNGISWFEALEELKKYAGTYYDPYLVTIFSRVIHTRYNNQVS